MASVTLSEKLDKIRSPNLQSQQHTAAVLQAVESTLTEQGTTPSPTAYFAALLALLDQSSANGVLRSDLAIPVVYLLDVIAPFAPPPILRAKFTQILALLAPVLLREDADAPLLRPAIGCLEALLVAQDSSSWELSTVEVGPRRAVAGLLNLSVDHRPKVRKRALEALRGVLSSPPPSPSLDHPAAGMCAETAMTSLRRLAEKATQTKKANKSADPVHDPALIHALQLIKAIASSSGGWPSKNIEPLCDLLLAITRTGNEHLAVAVFDVFEMIFEGLADEVASSKLPHLLEIVKDLRPSLTDTQLLPPWIAILSRGYDVFAQIEPEDAFAELPDLFDMVIPFLESSSSNIRISASECLVSFLVNCIPPRILTEIYIYDEKVLSRLVNSVGNLLSVQFQAAWLETLNIIGAMYDALRWQAHPLLLGITKTIGEMRSSDSLEGKKETDEIMGKAIRAMGPEAVLGVLPLNLAASSHGQPGRAWLLPLLRDFTSNTTLAHFKSEFLPLSQKLVQQAGQLGGAGKSMQVKIYETIFHQIWSALPGYCDLPLDLKDAFDEGFAGLLTDHLYLHVGLRLDIFRALQNLVQSNQAITPIEEEDDLVLQSRVSQDTARQNLEHLRVFAKGILAVCFNVYKHTSLAQSRGPILQTINTWLGITPTSELMAMFEEVCKLLSDSLQATRPSVKVAADENSINEMPWASSALLDLVVTMSIHLPRESFGTLFEIATLVVGKDDDPQLQKKAYKLIPRLAGSPVGKPALAERHQELQALLSGSAERVSAAARRERLAAITALLPLIPDTSLHFIPTVLSEVVICCKEQNERARTTAFDLLVLMGQRMASAGGAMIDNSKVPDMPKDAPAVPASLEEYFTMVSAGLAGSTPHMISASITAISRLLYEFRESLDSQVLADLVQTMDLFLTSNNREIVRSVLGFVKICTISLPVQMMRPRLASLIPNLMVWSHEHKSRFRSKVKHILDRMIRRFGYDVVLKYCPEADRKLINNIRKTKERGKRRKAATKDDGNGGDERDVQKEQHAGHFESEYDQALYSSDSSEDPADDSDHEVFRKADNKHGPKSGNAYIVEDDEEPLDLLDRMALGNISSTKPVKVRKRPKAQPKMDANGKLILGENNDLGDKMEIDTQKEGKGDESGVGAYVAALQGTDVPRRGLRGKLKWSNKRNRDDEGEELDNDDGPAAVAKLTRSKRGGPTRNNHSQKQRPGSKSGKGNLGTGRRGLGEEKRRRPSLGGRVAKADKRSRGRR